MSSENRQEIVRLGFFFALKDMRHYNEVGDERHTVVPEPICNLRIETVVAEGEVELFQYMSQGLTESTKPNIPNKNNHTTRSPRDTLLPAKREAKITIVALSRGNNSSRIRGEYSPELPRSGCRFRQGLRCLFGDGREGSGRRSSAAMDGLG
jgi:hypothetical protein